MHILLLVYIFHYFEESVEFCGSENYPTAYCLLPSFGDIMIGDYVLTYEILLFKLYLDFLFLLEIG
jgi:hypothetical protein